MAEMNNKIWEEKLLGKMLVKDGCQISLSSDLTFKVSDLPEGHRILPPGKPQTRDFIPERLNVFVDKQYKVDRVYFG